MTTIDVKALRELAEKCRALTGHSEHHQIGLTADKVDALLDRLEAAERELDTLYAQHQSAP